MIYGGVQAIWTTCNCFYGDYDLFEGLDGFFWGIYDLWEYTCYMSNQ